MAVQTRWDDGSFTSQLESLVWTASPIVRKYLHVLVSGDPACDWLTWVGHAHLEKDLDRALVLGCGSGWLERALAGANRFRSIIACDFAPETVARARATAEQAGITTIDYRVLDLEREEVPPGPFDAVFANDVLHHITGLEPLYMRLNAALAPAGRIIFNEYVGPNRFQYSDDVLSIMNALLACLGYPPKARPTVEEMIANDPTEAVRSEELLAFTERTFEVLERKNIGGTILQHLLYEIVDDYRFEVPRERAVIELLCTIEAMLVDQRRIPCDYVILAARKRGARVTRANRPLPPRPPAATDVERDPFWSAAARPPLWDGRLGRLALLAQQPRRSNLYEESRLAELIARIRTRRMDPWPDPPIHCLLRTAATLANE